MSDTLLHGRYRLIQVLGSGGFGQTFLAEDIQQAGQPTCVVKQFKPAVQDANFLAIARRLFFSEAATLKKLGSHDRIPALLDDFEEGEEFYLVQEYVPGRSLGQELTVVQRFDELRVIGLLQDVLEILDFVHRNQVIHRDIKPGNLIIRQSDGHYVLIDFGAVKEIQTQITTLPDQTNLTVGIGTQGYSPGEQLAGKPRFNSDLYALGVTAIQALTGLQPSQLPTHADTGNLIWQDQATVSPQLAAVLDRMVANHFSQRFQSAGEALQALERLAETPTTLNLLPTRLDEEAIAAVPEPGDSSPKRWRPGWLQGCLSVGLASLAATSVVVGMRYGGWLQPTEEIAYDRMVQAIPDGGPDPRLLIVGITETDIQEQQRFPLADATIAQALNTLQTYQPRAIGLDLLRDIPQPPGRSDLLQALQAPNVVVIRNLGTAEVPATQPPPGVRPEQVSFNDVVLDEDGVVRRNLMFADLDAVTFTSFALRLALIYLAKVGIKPQADAQPGNLMRLGKTVFLPLGKTAGGYSTVDDRGYQVLLRYRSHSPAQQVSLSTVLKRQLPPDWVRDKVVLIGTTAPSAKDVFFIPYSSGAGETARVPGVLIHAQMVSQFLDAALEGNALIEYWPEWAEALWILAWATLAGSLSWLVRHPWLLGLSQAGLLAVLAGCSFFLLTHLVWAPVVAPLLAIALTGCMVALYRSRLT
jgi:CHASE2 domain-containing sensor protein